MRVILGGSKLRSEHLWSTGVGTSVKLIYNLTEAVLYFGGALDEVRQQFSYRFS